MERGDTIGGYRVLNRLGAGGMGRVYEAEAERGGRVALKVFAADGARADFFRKRFLAEARLLSRLSHPRLVKVYDFGVDAATGLPYLAMDLILTADRRAKTLAEVLPDEADEARLALWFRDLASVIDYIHSQGVVHRDIKLNNVLVDSRGHAVLADFGISRVCDDRLRREIDVTKTMITNTNTASGRHVLGTRSYMAPELLRGEEATAASDAYALAVSFFRLLTGVWYDPNLGAGGAHGAGRRVLGLADMLDSFEYNWTDILGPMLADDPAQRTTVLVPHAERLAPKAEPEAAAAPGRRRAWPWAVALAAAALAAALAFLLLRRETPQPAPEPRPPADAAAAEPAPEPRPPANAAVPEDELQEPQSLTDGLFNPPQFMEK